MSIERIFFDWRSPVLPQAARRLWDIGQVTSKGEAFCDLSNYLIVVPGQRAADRLSELLLDVADASHARDESNPSQRPIRLYPPRIATPGAFPESLYRAKRPFASPMIQQLAWVAALRQTPANELREWIADPPPFEQFDFWLEIGELLAGLSRELGNEALSMRDVCELTKTWRDFPEQMRWAQLARLQDRYHAVLDAQDVGLWDRQSARRFAIQHPEIELHTESTIILIGTVDLSRAVRQLLDGVAREAQVQSWIFAEEGEHAGFDEHGCLIAESWQLAPLVVDDGSIHLVDSPLDQAASMVNFLGDPEADRAIDDVTICSADVALVPSLQRRMEEAGIDSRWLGGVPIRQTLPYRLLQVTAEYLLHHRFADFAALVRHPDVKRWLETYRADDGWLAELDQFQNDRLPLRVGRDASSSGNAAHRFYPEGVSFLVEQISDAFAPLAGKTSGWEVHWHGIRQWLATIYADCEVDRESAAGREVFQSLSAINAALDDLAAVPDALRLELSPGRAIELLLSTCSGTSIGLPRREQHVEILGWLDAPWDETPDCVIGGFNDHVIPGGDPADLFLPDQMRAKLQLMDDARRYARDCYALQWLLASKRHVRLVCGKRDDDSNPIQPSRLLLSVGTERIAERARRLFGIPNGEPWPPDVIECESASGERMTRPGKEVADVIGGRESDDLGESRKHAKASNPKCVSAGNDLSALRVPRPDQSAPRLTELAVTGFSEYLKCPYRFYLSHLLKLRDIDDRQDEMHGGTFGTILHHVLDRFGKSDRRDATDADTIKEFLLDALEREVAFRFPRTALPTAGVQIRQLRRRLQAFADVQSRRAADGWRIWDTEVKSLRFEFDVDGEPFGVTGRIDRIDHHPAQGAFALLDYKSSDSGKSPEATHRKKGEWIDLQLPLYRLLARDIPQIDALTTDRAFQLGYVVLPKNTDRVKVQMAEWSEDELELADEKARQVIRLLRERVFWPPVELPPRWDDAMSAICQVGVFDRHPDDRGKDHPIQ